MHGVASGDPEPAGVVLWTRVSGARDPVSVRYQVGTTSDLDEIVVHGETHAVAEHDFTVKVDARGLEPGTTYFYRFEAGGTPSAVGRTRTAPSGAVEQVRLGVVSCACWPHGFFNAYARLAQRDVDVVLHLGDYIYENGDSWDQVGRAHEPPHRLRTLADYRARHAQYKSDPDLQALHRRHPVAAVWDDHDVAGNAWRDGAADHDPSEDGDWQERKAAAIRAYLEWLPVRLPDPADPARIYRTLTFGRLARVVLLDTRHVGRDRPAAAGERPVATLADPNGSMLGGEQRRWLREQLRTSTSRWQVLGSQVMMAPLRALDLPGPLKRVVPGLVAGGVGVNTGQWDGYPAEREALFDFLTEEGIGSVVVLSGDLHSSWAGMLTLDPKGDGAAVGVEFLTPSVTSRSFAEEVAPPVPGSHAALRRLVASQNPHFPFFDLEGRGYLVVDITAERVRAQFWHVDTVAERSSGERLVADWVVRDGEPRLVPGAADPQAPSSPLT